jgi:hypothetical protein
MLKPGDEEWLSETHTSLAIVDGAVRGTIQFAAAYDAARNLFQVLDDNVQGQIEGVALAGRFTIRIEERTVKTFSSLPALFVEEIEPISDRHFGADKSACLCSLLEEDEFLTPTFEIRPFFEKLVIPFLYGQLFYSANQRWPWSEYAHFATGLLEAYGQHPDPTKIERLLQTLARYFDTWPLIRAAVRREGYIKGHTPCFCPKKDQMRRCHPRALQGIQQLRADIESSKIILPP